MKKLLLLTLFLPTVAIADDFTGTWETNASLKEDSCGFVKKDAKQKLSYKITQKSADTLEIIDADNPGVTFTAKKLSGFEGNFQGEQQIGNSTVKAHFWKDGKETKIWRTNYSDVAGRKCKVMFQGPAKKVG